MESLKNNNELNFINLLPFINELYLKKFLNTAGYKISEITLTSYMDMPGIIYILNCSSDSALIIFYSLEMKLDFIGKFFNHNYPKTNIKITLEEPHTLNSQTNYNSHILKNSSGNHRLTNTTINDKINFKIDYNNLLKNSYKIKRDEPGLTYTDEDVLEKQELIIGYLIKKMGSNLISGRSIMNVSLPVNIFDPRTLLQVYAYELSYAPIFLTRAYYSTDEVERVKWITAFLISQLHLSPLQTKPFNPIIGETYQCHTGNLHIYLEQTVNKPPTCNLYAYSDDGLYKVYGHIITEASTSVNSVLAHKLGKYIVEFNDGRSYKLKFPSISIKGTSFGSRLFNYVHNSVVIDEKFNLAVYLKFNPDERNSVVRFFGGKQKTYPDTFRGKIIPYSELHFESENYKPHETAKIFSNIEGEWAESMRCDEEVYWNVNDYNVIPMRKMNFILYSDSSLREDLKYFINSEERLAQEVKEKYEQIQRDDRKLRAKFSKK